MTYWRFINKTSSYNSKSTNALFSFNNTFLFFLKF